MPTDSQSTQPDLDVRPVSKKELQQVGEGIGLIVVVPNAEGGHDMDSPAGDQPGPSRASGTRIV